MRRWLTGPLCWLAVVGADDLVQETQTVIPLRGTSEATIYAEMRNGGLTVDRGSDYLLRGIFDYPEGAKKPTVSYQERDQGVSIFLRAHSELEKWRLLLTPQVPLSLEIDADTGPLQLILDDLRIRRLAVNKYNGASVLQMRGAHPDLELIKLLQGDGTLSWSMPGTYERLVELNAYLEVTAHRIGLSGTFDTLRFIEVEIAGANSHIELNGTFGALESVIVRDPEDFSDDLRLELLGKWKDSFNVTIAIKSGTIHLVFPEELGVLVEVQTKESEVVSSLPERDVETPKTRFPWLTNGWTPKRQHRAFSTGEEVHINVKIDTVDAAIKLETVGDRLGS